ncbi:hypothetical protein EZV62_004176 [Acer yangbiense]|uniref:Small-subunit processome Utp12 domain-containing protein n=1 Tax=Acer yangbiense TaxID=1000413 RepID=A0A5C7IJB4_9ROSI|nr:hypothetical protein EZV62_004176 [Acer yangbiense]
MMFGVCEVRAVACLSYSPDSQLLATGADDNKVKVWTVSSGFCFVTFAEHTNAITALHFMENNHRLLSVQFVSLAADQSGEVICAGTLDSFEIFVWSMKTGHLLDILSGHEGPVHGLAFSPTNAILAPSLWDKTVRLWDVFEGKGSVEPFPHTHDVLTVVYRPDGKQLACSTLDGQIHFWDPINGDLMYTIEGRRDIAGGAYILAGGSSKYIFMYDVADQVLLRRFQITHNLSLDGVLDFLNSKNMTEAGPVDLIDDDNSDTEEATTEGVLVYSIDESFIFDPSDLDIDVTPEAVDVALNEDQPSQALILSLRLNEDSLIKKCIFAVGPIDIAAVSSLIPHKYMQRLIEALAELLESCPHLEFILRWCQELCRSHGSSIPQNSRNLLPSLKSLRKAITRIHQDMTDTCSSNEYMLRYLCSVGDKK